MRRGDILLLYQELAAYFIAKNRLKNSQLYMLFATMYILTSSLLGFTRFHYYRPLQQEIVKHIENIVPKTSPLIKPNFF